MFVAYLVVCFLATAAHAQGKLENNWFNYPYDQNDASVNCNFFFCLKTSWLISHSHSFGPNLASLLILLYHKLATQYSTLHLLSYLYITNWNPTTTYIYESWCTSPLFFFFPSFFCHFPPFYQYFVPPYLYYYVSFEGSHTIKLCLLCQPSCLMFSISYSQPYFILHIFFCHV